MVTASSEELAAVMREVAEAQRGALARSRLDARLEVRLARRRGVPWPGGAPANLRPRRPRVWAFAVPGCAALVFFSVGALSLFLGLRDGPGRSVTGTSLRVEAEIPTYLETRAKEIRRWALAGGSEITLAPETGVRVVAASSNGARVHLVILRGRLDVHVKHRADTRWEVEAGGRTVHVVGTRFGEAWNERDRVFAIDMEEGEVQVTGKGFERPRRLIAGEHLRGRDDATTVWAEERTHTLASATPDAPSAEAFGARVSSGAASLFAPKHQACRRWRALARRGAFEAASRAIGEEGCFRDTTRLGARDLLLLGDVARVAGDAPHAEAVYREALRRFPAADAATFSLGVLAADARRDDAAAAVWFAGYLARYPHGPLAREAAGRLVEAEVGAGHRERAASAARAYLLAYPQGPHVAFAAATLGEAAR